MLIIFLILSILHPCTIGGAYDNEGRPYIFKVRDRDEQYENNKLHYNTSGTISYVGNINVGTPNLNQTWMGVNEQGLAIINAFVSDSLRTSDNGKFMHDVLSTCSTLNQFENLIQTDISNSYNNLFGNYLLIDNNPSEDEQSQLWLYEIMLENGQIISDIDNITEIGLDEYVCRSNFILDSSNVDNYGNNNPGSKAHYRYLSCKELLSPLTGSQNMNEINLINNITRSFKYSNNNNYSIPLEGQVGYTYGSNEGRPYGYISTLYSISRNKNVSASVIRGVINNEEPILTTMWISLGNPASSIFTPIFPIGYPPPELRGNILNGNEDDNSTSPICNLSNTIKDKLYSFPEIPYDDISQSKYIDSFQLDNGVGGGIWNDYIKNTELNIYNITSLTLNDLYDNHDLLSLTSHLNSLQNLAASSAFSNLNNIDTLKENIISDFDFTNLGNEYKLLDKSLHCPLSWTWNIPGQTITNNNQNPIIQYNEYGTFIINLDTSDNNNTDSSYLVLGCTELNAHNINEGNDVYHVGRLCQHQNYDLGDINFDSDVNISDTVLLIDKILHFYYFSQSFDNNEDLNIDGAVNITDIIILVDIILNN